MLMKSIRKSISALLALAMIAGCLSVGAAAGIRNFEKRCLPEIQQENQHAYPQDPKQ